LAAVLEEAWDDDIGAMTEHLGGGMLAAVVSPLSVLRPPVNGDRLTA
jgi:hypothetical protein